MQLPNITAGQSIDAGKWLIKPLKAWGTDQKIFGVTPKEGQKAVVFAVELMNRTTQSDSGYANTFHLPGKLQAVTDQPLAFANLMLTLANFRRLSPAREAALQI